MERTVRVQIVIPQDFELAKNVKALQKEKIQLEKKLPKSNFFKRDAKKNIKIRKKILAIQKLIDVQEFAKEYSGKLCKKERFYDQTSRYEGISNWIAYTFLFKEESNADKFEKTFFDIYPECQKILD